MRRSTKNRKSLSATFRLFRAFHTEIGRETSMLVVSGLTLLAGVAFRVLEPWPLKFIYDTIFHAKTEALPFGLLQSLGPQGVVAIACLSMVAITALAGSFEYASSVTIAHATSRILAEVRGRLFRHLANLSVSFHGRNKTGDLITHVTYDIDRVREVTVSAVLPFITNILMLAGMAAVMCWMNWQLGCIVLVAFPLFFLAVYRLTSRIKRMSGEQRIREGTVASTTAETIGAIRTVQAFSLQSRFHDVFSAANKKSLLAGNKVQQLSAGLERTVDILATGTAAVVLWFGVHKVLGGRLTLGDLIVFVNYLRVAFKPIRQLAKYLGQMARALASGENISTLLGTDAEIKDGPQSRPAKPFAGHIRFENVTFRYDSGQTVLHNVSFAIEPGEKVALVGASGSGKSTLASLLLRFHDPAQGRVLVDGEDIRNYTLESLRSQISMVMQDSPLFAVSVRENIAFGASGATFAHIVRAASLANAHGFILQMPHKYETVVGERGSSLSGGQRQRIAIARAAVRQSPIIVLDEPTAGLDAQNEREVSAALNRLAAGRTTLLITHGLQAAMDADRVLFVSEGRITEQGTHEALMQLNGGYAALFRRQTAWNYQQGRVCAVRN